MVDNHPPVGLDNQAVKIAHFGDLDVSFPNIRLCERRRGPCCAVLNNQTTLVNNNKVLPAEDPPQAEGESSPENPEDEPKYIPKRYSFHGTRGKKALAGMQYWQVRVEVASCNGQPLENGKTLVELGVATKPALRAAELTIAPTVERAFTVRLGLKGNQARVRGVLRRNKPLLTYLNLRPEDHTLKWMCGFLMDVAAHRLTVFDVTNCTRLWEHRILATQLYPAFSVVYSKRTIGARVSLSLEAPHLLEFSPTMAALLRNTINEEKSTQDAQLEDDYIDEEGEHSQDDEDGDDSENNDDDDDDNDDDDGDVSDDDVFVDDFGEELEEMVDEENANVGEDDDEEQEDLETSGEGSDKKDEVDAACSKEEGEEGEAGGVEGKEVVKEVMAGAGVASTSQTGEEGGGEETMDEDVQAQGNVDEVEEKASEGEGGKRDQEEDSDQEEQSQAKRRKLVHE